MGTLAENRKTVINSVPVAGIGDGTLRHQGSDQP